MIYEKLTSAIFNDIQSGLRGFTSNISMSLEQLEDDIIDERLQILKEYSLKGTLPKQDLLLSINCINVDCKSMENCPCTNGEDITPHFEIPQLLNDFGTENSIEYIGSLNKQNPFLVYTTYNSLLYQKYRKRGKDKPYVFIDITPNNNNMFDCFVFNAPMLKQVSVVGIFKDPRQLENYDCCLDEVENMTFVNNEIKRRLTEKKIRFYRQLTPQLQPNNQIPT